MKTLTEFAKGALNESAFYTSSYLKELAKDFDLNKARAVQKLTNFTEPTGILKKYMLSNDKALVEKILNVIESDAALKSKHDLIKESARFVYRGITLDKELEDKDIIEYDQNQDFVATSKSEQVAKDYAKGRNQLGGKDPEQNQFGAVITYEIEASDVVLDLEVFDSDFGALETLIDAGTARATGIERLQK